MLVTFFAGNASEAIYSIVEGIEIDFNGHPENARLSILWRPSGSVMEVKLQPENALDSIDSNAEGKLIVVSGQLQKHSLGIAVKLSGSFAVVNEIFEYPSSYI